MNANAVMDDLDTGRLAAELEDLQQRLDGLARHGTNPVVMRQLQRKLDAARAELAELDVDQPAA